MINIIATAASLAQGKALLEAGADTLYIGEEEFGLRLPASFSREDQKAIVELAHSAGKKVHIAMNAIFHPEKMKKVPDYLAFLNEIKPDALVVGDTGVIYTLSKSGYDLPFIYDAQTLVTNARQINFWAKKGAVGAVLAREVPFDEMKEMRLSIPAETLVYGATCIHHSKRPLLQNYYNYKQIEEEKSKERELFLSEPRKPETHYSIYEDTHGTHVFANNDVNLMLELPELAAAGFTDWKLDGLFAGEHFPEIVAAFAEAKVQLEDETALAALAHKVATLHPEKRGLDTGFYHLDPSAIK